MPEPTLPPSWFSASDRFKDPVGATRIGTYIDLLKRLPPGRMIDLGAGHGKFSVIAANLGWEVVALDARDERFPDDPRVKWVVGDVGEVDLAGYDLIACLGLWYHMTHDAQVRLAERAVPSTLIIDTHVAFDHPGHRNTVPLGELVTIDGDRGRFYYEGDIQHVATAAKGNDWSFWPTEDSLFDLLTRSGYDSVESYHPGVTRDRRFYFARTFDAEHRRALDSLVADHNRLSEPRPVAWDGSGSA